MSGNARDGSAREGASTDVVATRATLGRIRADLDRVDVEVMGAGGERAVLHATARGLCEVCESQISTCERLADALGGARAQLEASVEALTVIAVVVDTPPQDEPGEAGSGAVERAPERATSRAGRRRLRRFLGAGARETGGAAAGPPGEGIGPLTADDANLVVYCLGSLRAYQGGEMVTEWNGQKAQLLLRHLLVEHRRRMPRDFLAEILWPNADSEASRRNLHQAVYALRQTLRHRDPATEYILFRDESYFLNPEAGIWIDFIELESRAETARSLAREGDLVGCVRDLERAESLCSGDLFEDRLYDDRFRLLREHLRSVQLDVVSQLSESYLREGRHTEVVTLNQRALALDPYDEQAHKRIIEAYVALGRRGLALRQYDTCRSVLSEELGLEPSDELRRLRNGLAPEGR